jgi:hypothetical protein
MMPLVFQLRMAPVFDCVLYARERPARQDSRELLPNGSGFLHVTSTHPVEFLHPAQHSCRRRREPRLVQLNQSFG